MRINVSKQVVFANTKFKLWSKVMCPRSDIIHIRDIRLPCTFAYAQVKYTQNISSYSRRLLSNQNNSYTTLKSLYFMCTCITDKQYRN